MTALYDLQYEDIASQLDWRTQPSKISPRFMAISGDSHVVEPPEAYSRYIDPKYREIAPKIIANPDRSSKQQEVYWAEGLKPFVFYSGGGAGLKPQEVDMEKSVFTGTHIGAWNSKHRIQAQERDGIMGEILYPTIGMLLCALPDVDYMQACLRAFNQWLRDYCAENPKRLNGIGQSAARSPEDVIADFHEIRKLGLKGVMMPSKPSGDIDYDHPDYDKVWACAVEMGLPISFHVLTGRGPHALAAPPRGGKLAGFGAIVRELQDIAGLFIFGRVFERHPDLRIVLVEGDAGWAPHFCSRMNVAYKRHRYHMKTGELKRLPSEYFLDNIYMTFQDDWVALKNIDILNPRRLMWSNDYPHSDSTWPWSHELLGHHTKHLTEEQINWVLRDNVKGLYKLDIDTSAARREAAA